METTSPTTDGADQLADVLWRCFPHTHAQVTSGGLFVPYDYQRLIGEIVAEAIAKGGGRIIINAPSGHGKSEFIDFRVPLWLLDNFPKKRLLLGSYGSDFASDWGRKVRDEFETNPNLLTKLKEDSRAANRWNTLEGGLFVASGPDGSIMGRRFDVVIIDDPHKNWDEAHNPEMRSKLNRWFTTTLYSRLEPNATIIVLMQRFDVDDFTGFLTTEHSDPWKVIRLPARAEVGDVLGRSVGAPLCPQRFDLKALSLFEANNAEMYAAMFQQKPIAVGGGRLYGNYEPARNDDKTLVLRRDLPLDVSFDFNVNPGMHVILGQTDTQADLFTAVHEIHGQYMRLVIDPKFPGASALEHLEDLIKKLGGWQWPAIRVFADATGKQRRSEATKTNLQLIADFVKEKGWPLKWKVPPANPPVRSRIDAFNAALCDAAGVVHYKLHPIQCPRLKNDLTRMKPDVQGLEDKRDEELSHASSAEGYRVFWMRPLKMHRPSRGEVVLHRG